MQIIYRWLSLNIIVIQSYTPFHVVCLALWINGTHSFVTRFFLWEFLFIAKNSVFFWCEFWFCHNMLCFAHINSCLHILKGMSKPIFHSFSIVTRSLTVAAFAPLIQKQSFPPKVWAQGQWLIRAHMEWWCNTLIFTFQLSLRM